MNSWLNIWLASKLMMSSQAPFSASQTSMVSAVRTERALRRAASKQERMLEGFSAEKARNATTLSREARS